MASICADGNPVLVWAKRRDLRILVYGADPVQASAARRARGAPRSRIRGEPGEDMLDALASLLESRWVCSHDEEKVGRDEHGVGLEHRLGEIGAGMDLTVGLAVAKALFEQAEPLVLYLGDAIAGSAGAGVQLRGDGREETAARKHTAMHVRQEGIHQSQQPLDARQAGHGRLQDILLENLNGHLDGGQFQFLFRFEMGVQAAFAHADLGGQLPDGQSIQSAESGQAGGGQKNGFAALLSGRCGFRRFWRLRCRFLGAHT